MYNSEYNKGDYLEGDYFELIDTTPNNNLKDKIDKYIINGVKHYDFGNLILRGYPTSDHSSIIILPFIGIDSLPEDDYESISVGNFTNCSVDIVLKFGIIAEDYGNALFYLCYIRYFKDKDTYGMKFVEI